MRLTDFIADVLSLERYQKLLINKTRKYQIKQLRFKNKKVANTESENPEEDGGDDPLFPRLSSGISSLVTHKRDRKLRNCFFEQSLLHEEERNVDTIMDSVKADTRRTDRLLM